MNRITILLLKRLWLAALFCATVAGTAAQPADTLEVRFRLRESDLDLGFDGNGQRLDAFMERLRELQEARVSDLCIKVFAGASPEGPAELNRRLGERRGAALRQLLQQRMEDDGLATGCQRILVYNQGARWGQLSQLVARSDEPWRDRVLSVLRQPAPVGGEWLQDPRETALRRMDGGSVWRELSARYLPLLRSGGTAVLARLSGQPLPGRRDTLVIRDTVYYLPMAGASGTFGASGTSGTSGGRQRRPPIHDRPWALKTNLLLLATGTPNLQAEHTLGSSGRWSIAVEGAFAWWTLSHGAYANELVYGGVELRRWLGHRERRHSLSGWHVGLAVAGGLYDLEWKSRGYQGEALTACLNLGWQCRFGRRRQWCADLGVGLGMLFTHYREYQGSSIFPEGHEERYDDHLMFQRHGHLNWFGSPHVNISIGYLLGTKDKKKEKHIDKQ